MAFKRLPGPAGSEKFASRRRLAPGFLLADNLVSEGVPAITTGLRADVGRYLEFRAASFQSWHPTKRELLISTRFADSAQLHLARASAEMKPETFARAARHWRLS